MSATTPPSAAAGPPSVELIEVRKTFDDVVAVDDISLTVAPGEFLTLLGPSGCGKTTTLRMIGGFELPTEGEIAIDGTLMRDRPPYRRPVNTVFQSYALFPHLTVGKNIAYGLEMAGVDRRERARRVAEMLELVRLPHIEHRKPAALSGGQQQRVALARALINKPAVLLLDEPLGALDLKLRKAMQIELKRLNHEVGATFIYVTHDQEEALTMSDRIAVMDGGRILQLGSPREIYERPRNRFVADFIGQTNFLRGESDGRLDGAGYVTIDRTGGAPVRARPPLEPPVPVGASIVAIRPEKLAFADGASPAPAHWNSLEGTVREVMYLGTHTHYLVDAAGQSLVVHRQNLGQTEAMPVVGTAVRIVFDPDATTILTD